MAFAPPPLSSENILEIGSFPIRNTLLASWLVMAILIIAVVIFSKKSHRLVPQGFQNLIEAIVEGSFNFFNSVTGDTKLTKKVFPLVMTIMVFVFSANLLGLFPGFGPIGICEVHHESGHATEEHAAATETTAVSHETPAAADGHATAEQTGPCPEGTVLFPFLRSVNSDVNMTLALAIIAVVSTQAFGMKELGAATYWKKFFVNPFKDFIGSFVGILELLSEFSKMISFSFRLFGNIFAGEVLLLVISFLAPFVAPLPFYGLELFVAFVQALVFALLTLVFLKMAATAHHGPEHDHHEPELPEEKKAEESSGTLASVS